MKMRDDLYKEMYEMENTYWWHVGKRYLVTSLLKNFEVKNASLLNIECGTGLLMKSMETFSNVSGVDIEKLSIEFCKKRGYNVFKVNEGGKLPFHDKSIDIVTMMDVLEHVIDENKSLNYWDRILGHQRG